MEDGYCDVSGMDKDVRKAGECAGFVVYLTSGEYLAFRLAVAYKMADINAATWMSSNISVLQRFASIIDPISTIYDVPHKSIHIFSDTEGGLIAFNRNGSIFLTSDTSKHGVSLRLVIKVSRLTDNG